MPNLLTDPLMLHIGEVVEINRKHYWITNVDVTKPDQVGNGDDFWQLKVIFQRVDEERDV